ncbi:hypothetical protein [Streptomyces sp. NPDC059979]|uniref:hypothetical protein n=1 Tax=Streptomyces sp. NPDC059979 TaxID=3347021 RepID=UPI0036C68921
MPDAAPAYPLRCFRGRTRRRFGRKRGLTALGLDKTIDILEAAGDELLRVGEIRTADQAWTFMLILDAAATTVPACTGVARTWRQCWSKT